MTATGDSTLCWKMGSGTAIVGMVATIVVLAVLLAQRPSGSASTALDAGVGSSVIHTHQFTTKPQADWRSYQHVTLANGLEVLNIHDAQAVKSAFAVAVMGGSWDDPRDLPGLAHFCEHMLFMGSKNFPSSTGFDDFAAANAGSWNAYTSTETTVYHLEVQSGATVEASQRFSDFFRAPLFTPSATEDEVHAINSEHHKNVQDATWRTYAVRKSLAHPSSPTASFSTGDLTTLLNATLDRNQSLVEELHTWFDAHYCPSRMRVVTFGPDSLDVQLQQARLDFGSIPAGSEECRAPRKNWATPAPFPPERLQKVATVQGTTPQTKLQMFFPLPNLQAEFQAQPDYYINYMMSHGHENSLQRTLTDTLGLVTGMGAYISSNGAGSELVIYATLTHLGRDNTGTVLDVIYAYLSQIKRNGVNSALYASLQNISRLNWDWRAPASGSSTVTDYADRMTRLPVQHLLTGDSIVQTMDATLIESLFEWVTPQNMNVMIVHPNATTELFPQQNTSVLSLPHYGVLHTIVPFDDVYPDRASRWTRWMEASAQATVEQELRNSLQAAGLTPTQNAIPAPPSAIQNVPSQFDTSHMHATTPHAIPYNVDGKLFGERPAAVAVEEPRTTVRPRTDFLQKLSTDRVTAVSADRAAGDDNPNMYYRSGWMSNTPEVQMEVLFKPLVQHGHWELSTVDRMRMYLYSDLLGEEMVPKLVDLTTTGVYYSLGMWATGLAVRFSGYPALLTELADRVLQEFGRGIDVSDLHRYNRSYDQLVENLRSYTSMPISYAHEDRTTLMLTGEYSKEDALEALRDVTPQNVQSAVRDILLSQDLRPTSMVMGNIDSNQAKGLVRSVLRAVEDERPSSSRFEQASPAPSAGGIIMVKKHEDRAETENLGGGEVVYVKPVVRFRQPVELRKGNPRPGDLNDACTISYTNGVSTPESRVPLHILGTILQNVAFQELRTKRQLGYVVWGGMSVVSNIDYIYVSVQGDVLDADSTETLSEWVLQTVMPEFLENMTAEEFDSFKNSFVNELNVPPRSRSEEFSHFWASVSRDGQCFDLRNEMLAYVASDAFSTKQILIDTWNHLIRPSTGVRSRLAVKYFGNNTVPERRTLEDARRLWTRHGLPQAAQELLAREYTATKIITRANMATRQLLAEEGGYYPQDLNCTIGGRSPPLGGGASKGSGGKFCSEDHPCL